ncbi:snare associated Golgi protein [Gigaspora rosea]|uniref:Golgi apparatus membrane protein TVP38 n=1 Tax=Gigaspora rosea TaxID=44941 RepID=A0A397UWV0_9GLOM|nr:snare associated Golgi protein [Gigaspora rosea]
MLYCIIFLTTFPLVFGYSTLITLSGFIYGFGFGFLISYVAALTGAVTVFCLSRKWFKKPVRKWLNRNKSMSAVVRAVEKKGFKLLFLIRIAPYPYNILNMLLSATHLSLSTFTAATALSLFKLMIHVWIGSKMSSFSAFTSHVGIISSEIDNSIKPSLSKNNHFTKSFNFIVMLCSIAIGICIIIYVWILAKKAIKEVEDENGGEYIWLDGYEINEINEVGDNVILLGNGEMRFRRNSIVFCDDVESDSNINLKPHFNEKDSIQMQSIVAS